MISSKWFSGYDNLDDCHYIRNSVFVDEQKIDKNLEFDGSDTNAFCHLAVYENNKPVATGRIIIENSQYLIGRVAVLKEFRKKGYGDLVIRMLIRKAYDSGAEKQYVHAQISAKGFYEKLGFIPYGNEFDEAGINHICMVHSGDIESDC